MLKKILLLLILAMILVFGCNGEIPSGPVTLEINGIELMVELARNQEERAEGLMFRESLGEFEGMLFIFDEEQGLSFWMKNTLIPLSIAYISDELVINEIHDMEPLDLSSVPSQYAAKYALEVNRGFFRRHGISPGDRVQLPF